MKASTSYNDLHGTAAADITDFSTNNTLEGLSKKIGIDESKLKLVGICVWGTYDLNIDFLCIDIDKLKKGSKHMVQISLPKDKAKDLENIFKLFNVVLFNRLDKEHSNLEVESHSNWSDYMKSD